MFLWRPILQFRNCFDPPPLDQDNFVSIFFTANKNKIKGGFIGHRRTSNLQECQVAELHPRVAHLCHNNNPSNTTLVTLFDNGKKHIIRGKKITAPIHAIVCTSEPEFGFTKYNVSIHFLHVGGAMGLLLAWVIT